MNNQSDIILNRIFTKTKKKPEYSNSINYKINLNYNDLLNIWLDILKKNFLSIENSSGYKGTYCDNFMLYMGMNEEKLSYILNKLLLYHMQCINEDLIFIYINGSDRILYLLKSYQPLINTNTISLPYWFYFIDIKDELKTYYQTTFEEKCLIIRCY